MVKKPTYEELEQRAKDLEKEVHGQRKVEKDSKIFKTAVESSINAIGITDLEGKLIYVNDSCVKMWGYNSKDEILGRFLPEFWEGDGILKTIKELREKGVASGEDVGKRKNGSLFFVQFMASIFKDEVGNPSFMFGSFFDITERKRVEEAIKLSKKEWLSTFDAISDWVSLIDLKIRILRSNRAGENFVNLPTEERIGRTCCKLVHGTEEPIPGCPMQKMLQTHKNETVELYVQEMSRWLKISVDPITDKDGNLLRAVHIVRDITERKKAEEEKTNLQNQLQQAQKMEAIATLAGGIAHQFNNALSPINVNLAMLEIDYPGDEKIANYTKQMNHSAHRMAQLTRQLLAYARGGKYQAKTITINDFIDHTLPIIHHSPNRDIRIKTDLTTEMLNVRADQTQMQMVLSAILFNASEAMEGKGFIRVSTKREDIDEDFSKYLSNLKPGRYVCIEVEDNGRGMDKETRDRIFEPFFTTKFEGPGLGMAAAFGIVRNHDGWISVYSEVGRGTVIRIYLPTIESHEEEPKKPTPEPIKGTGTILLIEDDEKVMNENRALLEKLGYHVLATKTGEEAVNITKTFDGNIDLAILDLILPDMEGGEIYSRMIEVRPNLKVIVCSGYSIDGPAQAILDAGAQAFIQKPLTVVTLSENLREVFGGE